MMKRIYLSLAMAVISLICFMIVGITAVMQGQTTANEINFTLKTKGENIALYDNGKLVEQYDTVLVSALPPKDKTALKKGIKITSFEQLYSLLEDYDG